MNSPSPVAGGVAASPVNEQSDSAATVDPLTGLASRLAFSQLMAQLDADRDLISVALLSIGDLASINHRFGFDSGDALVRGVGRSLVGHISPGTMVARLGGNEFGILRIESDPDRAGRWLQPIGASVRAVASAWAERESVWESSKVQQPTIGVGAATGVGTSAWHAAVAALATARAEAHADATVHVGPEGFAPGRRNHHVQDHQCLDDAVDSALHYGRLAVMSHRLGFADGSSKPWEWVRIGAGLWADGDGFGDDPRPVDTLALTPALGRRVERWLVDQAAARLRIADCQSRITVAIPAEARVACSISRHLFPLLERQRVPPSRLVFELDESAVLRGDRRIGQLIGQLHAVGAAITISGAQGSWRGFEQLRSISPSHVKPARGLVLAAVDGDEAAVRSITTLALNAEEAQMSLVAPAVTDPKSPARLRELGFTYAEQPSQAEPAIDS